MENLKICISIDDVNPKPGWNIVGTPVEMWLRKLNEEFGAKFTLFIPSNYHGEYPLSKHKAWVQELNSIEWIELAAHGHLHMTSDPSKYAECEFFELVKEGQIVKRLSALKHEWRECGLEPWKMGWKNPGWLCSDQSKEKLDTTFKYVSLHYEHNRGMKWHKFNKVCFFGHDGIQQTDISIHNGDMIMFTSHISGQWNHNVWNEPNYEQLRLSLSHLCNTEDCYFKTLNECI